MRRTNGKIVALKKHVRHTTHTNPTLAGRDPKDTTVAGWVMDAGDSSLFGVSACRVCFYLPKCSGRWVSTSAPHSLRVAYTSGNVDDLSLMENDRKLFIRAVTVFPMM